MKRSNKPSGDLIPFRPESGLVDLRKIMRQAFAEIDSWLDPRRLEELERRLAHQLQVYDRDQTLEIVVSLPGVEKPEDVQAQWTPGGVRLERTVQRETRVERDAGTMFSYQYERFERTVPLPASARWADRSISCLPGEWRLVIPKN